MIVNSSAYNELEMYWYLIFNTDVGLFHLSMSSLDFVTEKT